METLWDHPEEPQHLELVRRNSWFKFHPNQPTVYTIGNVLPVHIPSDSKHCGKTCGNLVENLPLDAQRDVLREIGGVASLSFGLNWTQAYDPQSPQPRTIPPAVKQAACKPTVPWEKNVPCPSHVVWKWFLNGDVLCKVAVVEHPKREPALKELSWVAPSYTFESETGRQSCVYPLQTEIHKVAVRYPFRELVWKRTVGPVKPTVKPVKLAWVAFLPATLPNPITKPRWVAPNFPFAPRPKVAPYKKPPFRNEKRRLGKSYLCPECFAYVVVGYQTEQQGKPLWTVPMWDTYIIKELRKLLEAPPSGKKETLKLVAKDSIENASMGANLGESEVMVPVIKRVGGVFHRLNHECTVGCVIGQTKSKLLVVIDVKAATA